jgi:hypothetical protein
MQTRTPPVARVQSRRPLPARERQWQTKSGKAEFFVPETLD